LQHTCINAKPLKPICLDWTCFCYLICSRICEILSLTHTQAQFCLHLLALVGLLYIAAHNQIISH